MNQPTFSITEWKDHIRPKVSPARVAAECEEYLHRIEMLFVPECRITLLVRSPHLPDGDLVLTRDDLDKAVGALMRARDAEMNYQGEKG